VCGRERERNRRAVEILRESVRGRERKIDRGVEREVNVGERGRCRRDRGEIVGCGGERKGWRGIKRVHKSVIWEERKTKRRGRDREGGGGREHDKEEG
jgi:hypothetical protein